MAKITLLPENETQPAGNTRPLMINIKNKEQLYSLYMPYLKNAGIFVPGTLFAPPGSPQGTVPPLPPPGSRIMMILTLPEETHRNTVSGKVAWVTYAQTSLGAVPGVGVHFDDATANKQLRDKIEKLLAGIIGKSDARTMTI